MEEGKKRGLWAKCKTKTHLDLWVEVYLGLKLPDQTIDPLSNTNPLDVLWELYSRTLSGDEEFVRVLMTASRDGGKTLVASIYEILGVLHLERDVCHSAAIESQAKVATGYITGYAKNPYIAPFVTKLNDRRIEITRYKLISDPEIFLSPKQFSALPDTDKTKWREHTNFIQLIITNLRGSNAYHGQIYVLDEAELADPKAVEESKMIPTQTRDGKPAVTLITTSRKFAFGMVQKELDAAERTGLHYRHWNIIDVSKICPPSRHLPEEPKIPIYVNAAKLDAVSEAAFEGLRPEQRQGYEKKTGFSGCLKKCKMFASCQGLLATKQKSTMPFLKNLTHVQSLFMSLSPETALAQLLCHRPSSAGMVYPRLDYEKHVISVSDALIRLGEDPQHLMSWEGFVEVLKNRSGSFYGGIDWGFNHHFAHNIIYVENEVAFVLGAWSAPDLDPTEKLEAMEHVRHFNAVYYPDTASPESIKLFKKHGWTLRGWKKGPGSVGDGIEVVRRKINSPGGLTGMYFIHEGPGVVEKIGSNRPGLFRQLQQYHFKVGLDGRPTEVPDEVVMYTDEGPVIDDEVTALRYVLQNVFPSRGRAIVAADSEPTLPARANTKAHAFAEQQRSLWNQVMDQVRPQDSGEDDDLGFGPDEGSGGVKGKFYFNFD